MIDRLVDVPTKHDNDESGDWPSRRSCAQMSHAYCFRKRVDRNGVNTVATDPLCCTHHPALARPWP
eukprot:m.76452 g.76452  ORF g.76452 m.76452 type:complete len:66 (-) comp9062_c0_seq1:84-281(-)